MASPHAEQRDRATTAITNVALFDGWDRSSTPRMTIVFGERITDLGPSSTTSIPRGCRVMDAVGKTVIPGLIDMHVHLKPGAFALFLAHGVTAVKDVGNQLDQVLGWRDAERAGYFTSPRLHVCGPLLDGDPPVWPHISRVLTDVHRAMRTVDELARLGVDALKLYMRLPPELIPPIIERAHQFQLPVTAHLGGVAATAAVGAGLDGIEHAVQGLYNDVVRPELRLEADDRVRLGQSKFWAEFLAGWADVDVKSERVQEVIELLVQKDSFIVCTLAAHGFKLGPEHVAERVDLSSVPEALTEDWPELVAWFTQSWSSQDFVTAGHALEKVRSFVGAFHHAGGRVLAGTDSPFPYLVPGASLHQELELLVESGLTPVEALRAATSAAAAALGRAGDLGTVQVGKLADFVVVRDDPLVDIRAIRTVEEVFKGGRGFKPADLAKEAFAELEEDHPATKACHTGSWAREAARARPSK